MLDRREGKRGKEKEIKEKEGRKKNVWTTEFGLVVGLQDYFTVVQMGHFFVLHQCYYSDTFDLLYANGYLPVVYSGIHVSL